MSAEAAALKGQKVFLKNNRHLLMPMFVMAVVTVMIIPIPAPLLDILITFNIVLSLLILLMALYIKEPVQFSAFPSVLLIITLFRLSLNVATTRQILLCGNEGVTAAGQVISAFGQFVIGGNYVIGLVIFVVLLTIQYVVITHGSVRTSEVTARFKLDALPGKQMSIDADLNSGLIDEETARERRREVLREADFYGSMDGAIRFTGRDAIASIIITLINIIAGLVIGTFQYGLPLKQAAQTFTILTVGDGLVSAIPALLVSVGGGIITTRAVSDSNLGDDVAKQVLFDHRVIAIAASVISLFALVPGLPKFSFIFVGGFFGTIAYFILKGKSEKIKEEEEEKKKPAAGAAERSEDQKIAELLEIDILGLQLGYQLLPLVNPADGIDLPSRIQSIRRQIAMTLGFVLPPVHIRDNLRLKSREYAIMIKGVEVAKNQLHPDRLLAIDPGTVQSKIQGIDVMEPTYQLPAVWINPSQKDEAQQNGYTIVDCHTVMMTHFSEVVAGKAHEILGRHETQDLVDHLAKQFPRIVDDLIPKYVSHGLLQKTLQNLLRERVSIRDLRSILEALSDAVSITQDVGLMTEYVRQRIGRSIVSQYLDSDDHLPVFILNPEMEQTIADAVEQHETSSNLALNPQTAQKIIQSISDFIKQNLIQSQPIVIVSPIIRMHLKRFTERFIPSLVVLSHDEIPPETNINNIGVVNW